MGHSATANINPHLLIWAREQQGYDIQFVAQKLKFPKLALWENGEKKPSIPQILKLAHFYKRPSAVFFLSKPPASNKYVDFRINANQPDQELSPETRTEIRVCESRRNTALELSESLKLPAQLGLPPVSLHDDIEKIVMSVRRNAGIKQEEIYLCRNDQETLNYWIYKLEQCNILIFRSITLNGWNPSFKEVRGTSSYYPEFPWMLINSQEHERGQLFTLGHELGHILLKGSSICTLDEDLPDASLTSIEQFCNKFSAALHLPESIFSEFRKQKHLRFDGIDQLHNTVAAITKHFHISPEAAARRLYSLGYAGKNFYLSVRKQQTKDLAEERLNRGPGGDGTKYYLRVIKWNGMKYTHLVFDAYHENLISLGETAYSLRTDVKHLETIEQYK